MTGNTLTWKIEGLKELEQNMRDLGGVVAPKWTNGALRAGVRTIQLATLQNVPVDTGTLRDTVRIRRGKRVRMDDVREYFVISGSRKAGGGGAFYAHMQELGTKPHEIRVRQKGKALAIGGGFYTRVAHHPGHKATHYMERSARNAAKAAFDAYAEYIRQKVQKTGPFVAANETE